MGIVILAWDATRAGTINPLDGDNVVLHEFSHQLDTLDGEADGVPILPSQHAYSAWTAALTSGFVQLCRDARKDRRTVLDHYGATNHAEFFAVATEAFFEKPRQLRAKMPALYDVLAEYYRQDPLAGPSAA
jgi:Mlc titration factor MtfA (ptsG expression regulator)